MGKYKRVSEAAINGMAKKLKALPAKKIGKTRQEAAKILENCINEAIAKGYTLKELSEILKEGETRITPPMLREAIRGKSQPHDHAAKPHGKTDGKRAEKPNSRICAPAWFSEDLPDSEL